MDQSKNLANVLRRIRPEDLHLMKTNSVFMNSLLVNPSDLGVAEIISSIKSPGKAILLLYRTHPGNDGLVFAPPGHALEVGVVHKAIQTAKTWGDFKRMIPLSHKERLEENFAESEGPPTDDELYNSEWLPGYFDGDYPMWLQSYMHCWIPAKILNEFGNYKNTSFNGDYFEIPHENLDGISAALDVAGFAVLEAKNLLFW